MSKSAKQTGRNKRSFVPMDPAMQREYDSLRGNEVQAMSAPNPPPSRESSQTSSKVGVQKNAPDASSPGVSLAKASKHSHRRAQQRNQG